MHGEVPPPFPHGHGPEPGHPQVFLPSSPFPSLLRPPPPAPRTPWPSAAHSCSWHPPATSGSWPCRTAAADAQALIIRPRRRRFRCRTSDGPRKHWPHKGGGSALIPIWRRMCMFPCSASQAPGRQGAYKPPPKPGQPAWLEHCCCPPTVITAAAASRQLVL